MSNIEVPAHVSPALVRDFNYLDSSSATDVYSFFRQLHEGPDIFYTPRNHGHWVATRFEDMEYILDRTAEFCSETHTIPKEAKLAPVPLVEMDGQIHKDFRKLLHPFFLPKAMQDLQVRAREFTSALIEGFYAKGECDLLKTSRLRCRSES
jgi:cytochrome P450